MAPFPLCASPNPLTKAGNPLGGDTSFPAPLRARCARTSCPLRGYQQGGAGEKSLSVGQRAAPLSATGHWVSWERFGSTPQAGESRPRGSRSLPASPRPQNAGHTRPAPKKSAVRGGRGSTLQSFRKQHKENPESLVFYKGKGGGYVRLPPPFNPNRVQTFALLPSLLRDARGEQGRQLPQPLVPWRQTKSGRGCPAPSRAPRAQPCPPGSGWGRGTKTWPRHPAGQACDSRRQHPPGAASPAPSPAG